MEFRTVYQKYNIPKSKQIVLYDGLCNLCNFFVQWIVKYDKKDVFRLAHINSTVAKDIISIISYKRDQSYETVILINPQDYYVKSSAALRITKQLGFIGKLLSTLRFLPRNFRDCIYTFVSRNRYRWFGTKSNCSINFEMHSKHI